LIAISICKNKSDKTNTSIIHFYRLFVLSLLLLRINTVYSLATIKMVEGHSVHRIASRFRSQLVGKKFTATSPNGRFTQGATEIDGKVLSRMEAVGKNLFAFFSDSKGTNGEEDDAVVGKICFLQYI